MSNKSNLRTPDCAGELLSVTASATLPIGMVTEYHYVLAPARESAPDRRLPEKKVSCANARLTGNCAVAFFMFNGRSRGPKPSILAIEAGKGSRPSSSSALSS